MQSVILAADWFTITEGFGTDLRYVIFTYGIPAMAGIFILVVGFKTRSPGPTIMAVIFGGILIGLSLSIDTIGETTSETVNQYTDGGGTVLQGDQ